jgi:hypothetical protein
LRKVGYAIACWFGCQYLAIEVAGLQASVRTGSGSDRVGTLHPVATAPGSDNELGDPHFGVPFI